MLCLPRYPYFTLAIASLSAREDDMSKLGNCRSNRLIAYLRNEEAMAVSVSSSDARSSAAN